MKDWDEWRRKLHEEHPEVRPEYTNRLGIWHEDFIAERPWQDENGNTHYPSQSCYVPVVGPGNKAGIAGFINKACLLRRGWTRTAIKRLLGEPDRRIVMQGRRKDRPECLYDNARVIRAERDQANAASRTECGGLRLRKAHQPPSPSDLDEWDDGYIPEDRVRDLGIKRARNEQLRMCVLRRAWRRQRERKILGPTAKVIEIGRRIED